MKILFIYPTNRHEIYLGWKKGVEPSTLMYGFCELKKEEFDVNFSDTFGLGKKVIKYLFLPLEAIFYKIIGISLHFDHVFSQIQQIKNSKIIISTSDSTSIPVLILKKIGLLTNKKIFCLSIDLINRVKNRRLTPFLRNLYSGATQVIVFSRGEKRQFEVKLKLKNVEYIQFGIDTDFFNNKRVQNRVNSNNYILTVGRDRSRNYDFFMKIAKSMPKQKFIAICSKKNIVSLQTPKNVKIVLDANYETIRNWFKQSFCFLLPLHELHRASGQIAFLEAISSGVPIIVSPVNSIKNNYSFDKKDGVHFIEKDIVKWIDKIQDIEKEKQLFVRHDIPSVKNFASAIKI